MTTYFYFTDEIMRATKFWVEVSNYESVPYMNKDCGCRRIVGNKYYFYSDVENNTPLDDTKKIVHHLDKIKICDKDEIEKVFTIRKLESV